MAQKMKRSLFPWYKELGKYVIVKNEEDKDAMRAHPRMVKDETRVFLTKEELQQKREAIRQYWVDRGLEPIGYVVLVLNLIANEEELRRMLDTNMH